MSEAKTDRNKEMFYAVVRRKRSYAEVARIYGVSETRVKQVVANERARFRESIKKVKPRIPELDQICSERNINPSTKGRIINSLSNAGYLKHNKWKKLSRDDLLRIKNLGEGCVNLILEAQKL